MALDTVRDYVKDVRTLLQDTVHPYRYDDPSLITAFNVTLMEARRLRPDLFVYQDDGDLPDVQSIDGTEIHIERPFRLAIVYGITAHAFSRDQEDVQDTRASAFMNVFQAMLLGLNVPAIGGGAPAAPAKG